MKWISKLAVTTVFAVACISAQAQTVVEYIHTDALGSPVVVTDANQNVIEHTEYEPYGAQINSQAQDGPGYTGHVSDTSTGLSYMQQRYYDPLIGRFASVDPVSAESNSGGNFNRYWYASNNPYRFYDPDGRYTCSGSKSGCATVEDAIQKARSAAAGLPEGSTERARLEKITDMYGTAGEKNAVKITVKNVPRLAGTRVDNGIVKINFSLQAIANQSGGPNSEKFSPELAGIVGHEGDHGLTLLDRGMPRSRAEVKTLEVSAFRSQGQTHRGMQYNGSNYRLWSSYKGINENQVEAMAEESVKDWCAQGGSCK